MRFVKQTFKLDEEAGVQQNSCQKVRAKLRKEWGNQTCIDKVGSRDEWPSWAEVPGRVAYGAREATVH